MTQEEVKQLLLIDLCARLPYGVIVKDRNATHELSTGNTEFVDLFNGKCHIKPYLRPMSSMTEEERRELQSFFPGSFGDQWLDIEKETIEIFECPSTMILYLNDSKRVIDFFNSHHIDYLGFIEDGLALEAPKDMYKIK